MDESSDDYKYGLMLISELIRVFHYNLESLLHGRYQGGNTNNNGTVNKINSIENLNKNEKSTEQSNLDNLRQLLKNELGDIIG